MGLSNTITGIVNFITLLLSVPLIAAGIWLATKLNAECVQFLEWPIIAIGIIILLVSLAGFFGACWRIAWLLYIYLIVMFFIILLLLTFITFAFIVTKDGPAAQSGHRTYNLQDYSTWLQDQVESASGWRKIVSCIKDSKVCQQMNNDIKSAAEFYAADLSSVQSGCCIPPPICGYTIKGPTTWTNPVNVNVEADCTLWSNDQTELCYACDSCKAGVLASVKQKWQKVAVLSVVVLIVLVVLYVIACCAFRNAETEGLFKRYEEQFRSSNWRRRNWFRSWARNSSWRWSTSSSYY